MYIEQLKNKKDILVLYLILPIGFFLLMGVNYVFSSGIDTNEMLQQMIDDYGKTTTFIMMVAPLSFFCLMLLLWVKFIHRQSITSLTTSRPKIDWKRVLFSFTFWAAIVTLMTLVGYFLSPEEVVLTFNFEKFWPFLLAAVILLPLQTSFEEYFFRGYLMQGLGLASNSRAVPFITTSVLFGLLHIANPEVEKMGPLIMIYYIGTGFFLGIITLMDEGLEIALGFHAANNLVGALLITNDWGALQTDSVFTSLAEPSSVTDVLIPVFILYPILLYMFSRKYNWQWSKWREKLTGKLQIE